MKKSLNIKKRPACFEGNYEKRDQQYQCSDDLERSVRSIGTLKLKESRDRETDQNLLEINRDAH